VTYILHLLLDLFNTKNTYVYAKEDYDIMLLQSGFEAIIGELIQHEDRYTIELLIKM